ncbi:hypothetical protein HYU17_05770 [Candidatus Woesearchaeota archaeon]|nr:hypothetical protein [Candidatus Woesearchaeota archaeon]
MNATAAFSALDRMVNSFVSGDARVNVAIILLLGFSAVIAFWYVKFLAQRT